MPSNSRCSALLCQPAIKRLDIEMQVRACACINTSSSLGACIWNKKADCCLLTGGKTDKTPLDILRICVSGRIGYTVAFELASRCI
ncbi:hypothetical protein DPEC_G00103260 [Dallia pectoralis]|uniref:Uncharacterized protein n=1 Tax=Dallia pectoralis TaxID=75939 RepID=A0ACC2GXG4_DALPE|nr:hypothetical protein DPEC_G00103260 [Dallia pectoralis]